ncbi:MAG: hypothetical protein IJ251_02265 [Oscillospiraceae bacterium]|nr:hypothetical protein [Oscillospiraceae bacterium]
MKKIITLFAAFFLIMLGRTVSAEVYLKDEMDLYPDDQYIIDMMEEASAKTGWNIGIVTCDYDYDPEYYGESTAYEKAGKKAEELNDSMFGANENSVFFLCDVGYRYVCIANEPRKYIVGDRFDSMINEMEKHYFDYDDVGTATAFISNVVSCYERGLPTAEETAGLTLDENGYYTQFDSKPSGIPVFPFIAGFVIAAFIGGGVVKSYRKPAPVDANTYLDKNELDIYHRNTMLVSTRHYHYNVDTSSGGSSGHHGGGGFSGGHHGGGGHGGHR